MKSKGFSARVKERIWVLYKIHGPKWKAILNDLIEEQRIGKISSKARLPADERPIKSYIEERVKREAESNVRPIASTYSEQFPLIEMEEEDWINGKKIELI